MPSPSPSLPVVPSRVGSFRQDPPADAFSCTRSLEGGGSIRLILAGELDLAARPIFESAVGEAQHDADRVVLDLAALTLIDCAALFAVFAAAERSRREGTALILMSPGGQVRRVLDLIGAPPGAAVLDQDDVPATTRRLR